MVFFRETPNKVDTSVGRTREIQKKREFPVHTALAILLSNLSESLLPQSILHGGHSGCHSGWTQGHCGKVEGYSTANHSKLKKIFLK